MSRRDRAPLILTDRGERVALAVIGYGRAAVILVPLLALYGIAGYIESL